MNVKVVGADSFPGTNPARALAWGLLLQALVPRGGAFGDATNTHRCYTLRTQTNRRMAKRVLDGEDSLSVLARRARFRFALREQQNSTPREAEVDAAAAAWRLASLAQEEERWAGAPGANPHLPTTSIPISPG
ncbi:hypothetical protein C8R47DRAFT_1159814 [Mycena vitilis]|nr:hypothetical protein C8R47DRAFT_1159814 [Mycena vitilis]